MKWFLNILIFICIVMKHIIYKGEIVLNNYCIYLRKSRKDTEKYTLDQSDPLERHEKILLELAEKMNIQIKETYKEVVSGDTINSRPVMKKLLSEVGMKKWCGVLVIEIERLARGNTIDQGIVAQTFKLSNTKIITPIKIYDPTNEYDEEYFEFGLFMSRREYKTINRRLQRGKIQSIKEGKYVANQPPYGYKRKKIYNKKGFTLSPQKEESKVVKLIFDLYTNGEYQSKNNYKRLGASLIAQKLNQMYIPTRKGGHWSSSTIRGILKNPIYIGKIRWNFRPTLKKVENGEIKISRPKSSDGNYILHKGLHPAIINKKTFDLAQEILNKKKKTPVNNNLSIKNPLAGLIICGKCGHKMLRRPYKKNNEIKSTLICNYKHCENVSSDLNLVEQRLIEAITPWMKKYSLPSDNKILEKEYSQIKNIKNMELLLLKKRLNTLEKQMDKSYDMLEQNVYTKEEFIKRKKQTEEKIKILKLKYSILEKKDNLNLCNNNYTYKKGLMETYLSIKNPKIKNLILKEIIEKVIYTKEKGNRWDSFHDVFELKIYPKLPISDHL